MESISAVHSLSHLEGHYFIYTRTWNIDHMHDFRVASPAGPSRGNHALAAFAAPFGPPNMNPATIGAATKPNPPRQNANCPVSAAHPVGAGARTGAAGNWAADVTGVAEAGAAAAPAPRPMATATAATACQRRCARRRGLRISVFIIYLTFSLWFSS